MNQYRNDEAIASERRRYDAALKELKRGVIFLDWCSVILAMIFSATLFVIAEGIVDWVLLLSGLLWLFVATKTLNEDQERYKES